jgi:hypothetical protein
MRNKFSYKRFFRAACLVLIPVSSLILFTPVKAQPSFSEGTCTVPPADTDYNLFWRPNEDNPSELIGTTKSPVYLTCSGDMLDGVGTFSNHAHSPFFVLNVRASGVGSFINVGTFEGTMDGEEITAAITCIGQTHDGFLTYSIRCVIKGNPEGPNGILTIPVVTTDDDIPEDYRLTITSK